MQKRAQHRTHPKLCKPLPRRAKSVLSDSEIKARLAPEPKVQEITMVTIGKIIKKKVFNPNKKQKHQAKYTIS